MLYASAYYVPLLLAALALHWSLRHRTQARIAALGLTSLALLCLMALGRLPATTVALHVGMQLLTTGLSFAAAARLRRAPSTAGLVAILAVCLLPLIVYKYLPAPDLPADSAWRWAVPLGISYLTFKQIHFVVESARGRFADVGPAAYVAYIFFFPMFAAGPIERMDNFAPQLERAQVNGSDVSVGVERILIGAAKKFLLADAALGSLLPPSSTPLQHLLDQPWSIVLLICLLRFLQTYADFSGYTDMALGTARLFGFRLMENFNYPLLRSNLAEFWRAWHISLSSFARDYVYFPLLGRWRSPVIALLACMLAIGLWHAGNPGWILWGLHHGLGLVMLAEFHRVAPRWPALQRVRATHGFRLAATVATWFYVTLGYALTLKPESLGSSLAPYLRIVAPGVW